MRHRKQILLFLAAVFIPSLTLILFTQKIVRQEEELAVKRLSEERDRLAKEIGRDVLLRLERMKLEESRSEAAMLAHPDEYAPSRPEIVMLGVVEDGRLFLPWELRPAGFQINRESPGTTGTAEKIRAGERAEFQGKDLALAANLYRQALAGSENAQRENVRLLLARALAKSGQTAESGKHYRVLLALHSREKDQDGIPLYLYAAERLSTAAGSGQEIVARIGAALKERPWLSPPEASLADSVLERISAQAGSSDRLKTQVMSFRSALASSMDKAQRLLVLQKGFSGYFFQRAGDRSARIADSAWEVGPKGDWLLGLGPPRENRQILLVVDIRVLSESLSTDADFRQLCPDEFLLTTAEEPSGAALGLGLRGLNVVFQGSAPLPAVPALGATRPFYILTMAAVVIFAGLGGYLLWRDVQRDLNLAEIRSQFAASVSHELKTPLTAIRMFAETMRLGRIKDDETRHEYLDTIVNESERLSRLLSNVLDMSKIEQGKKIYRPRPCALAPIVRTAARTMEYPLRQQGFAMRIDVEDDLPDVPVDPDALEQALLNLISNAIKYSGTSREIGLKLSRSGSWALLQVSDRGVGIPPHDRQRIFEKYYRVASRENEQVPGTGLGLSLVAHFVQAHGGRVEVDGSPGCGSTFSIYLPMEGCG